MSLKGCPRESIHNHRRSQNGRPSLTYSSWRAMRKRCEIPGCNKYENYGGRGIRVCARWQDFRNFLSDMGERPEGKTLERLNSDGNYEPGNCTWATWETQAQNRKSTKMTPDLVRLIRISIKSLGEISKEFGISKSHACRIRKYQIWGHVE